jgi:hypothetical protein
VAISSAVTGQTDPGSSHSCEGGRTLTGALIVVQ